MQGGRQARLTALMTGPTCSALAAMGTSPACWRDFGMDEMPGRFQCYGRGDAIFTLQHGKADMQAFHNGFESRVLASIDVMPDETEATHARRTLRGNPRA